MVKYSKGSGTSIKTAVVVSDVQTESDGITAEYEWLAGKFGARNKDWKLVTQSLVSEEGKHYDRMDIVIKKGKKERSVYFDITAFFGKW